MIRIYGVVQGVGFRPFVRRIADRLHLRGSVANKGSYVEVHAQGTAEGLREFLVALRSEAPERSTILKIDARPEKVDSAETFEIVESEKELGDIFVSPDIATCPECRRELFDPSNRRYLHPFINCTACGPRVTILDSMPYDRVRTSMGVFPLCPACEYEYTHVETRRYDAQPVCCPDCGPVVYLIGRAERGAEAISAARRLLREGKIVAVKGIGGFHLCCDATSSEATARLRRLKHRPAKPFAVMMRDEATVRREVEILPEQEPILNGPQKPILLLRKKPGGKLAPEIAPDNPSIGVMLPYAPVQMLLFDFNDGLTMPDSLVMTSGNVSGAPICRSDEDATREIGPFCDALLSHNRTIRLRADDSVLDFFEGRPLMVRRSRGYAPLPVMLSGDWRGEVLGIGGELKNTFCLGRDSLFYPSPYVGDMADRRTVEALRESISRMETLLEISPKLVVCDLHPKYNTVQVAEELGRPLAKIQHHYAHILSCMAENDFDGDVIGVSFDGTGYGTDGTIWGGEFLRASYRDFERLGNIEPFIQVGGDASAREGWRIAVAMIEPLFGERAPEFVGAFALCSEQERILSRRMAQRRLNSVVSTSAGRLFDAVSAILGIRRVSTFEGEASMALQFAAERWTEKNAVTEASFRLEMPLVGTPDRFALATGELVRRLATRRLAGENAERLAFDFHALLADLILAGCEKAREKTRLETVALSGGVFQNRLLTGLCAERLRRAGFRLLLHRLLPPNDGGIALGQAVWAMKNGENWPR